MKKFLWLIFFLFGFALSFKAMADDNEVAQKTDGDFVGSDSSFSGQNLQNQTDGQFVGSGTTNAENMLFAGQTYQQQVNTSTIPVFAQENTQTPSDDGSFAGENEQGQTDGTFSGQSYGK